jgi:hypothetical protein
VEKDFSTRFFHRICGKVQEGKIIKKAKGKINKFE